MFWWTSGSDAVDVPMNNRTYGLVDIQLQVAVMQPGPIWVSSAYKYGWLQAEFLHYSEVAV